MPKAYRSRLPEPVRARAETLGEQGVLWMSGLDACVDELENEWGVQVGQVRTGGSEALVLEVRLHDGENAILKIGLPGSADLAKEARIFELAAGRGYANLIAHDPERNALLLEKLGASVRRTEETVDAQIRALCNTLRDAWIPLDADNGLMTGAEKARWLADFIEQQARALGQPCEKTTIATALDYTEERAAAFSARGSVLVHGDAHADNALRATGTRYKFVDPDGLCAEKACDLAALMRDWNHELLAGDALRLGRQRCELLAELTDVDEHAIWQWGFIERVSTGLHLLELGMKTEATDYLAVADRF